MTVGCLATWAARVPDGHGLLEGLTGPGEVSPSSLWD